MKIIANTDKSDIANVYIGETSEGKLVEFVESIQPPIPFDKKWVLIVSTLYGCPISCSFCDCSFHYEGKISKEDIFAQIDFLVKQKFDSNIIPVDKFKIQFARMGEPSLNPAVLDVLDEFNDRYNAKGFLPSISTVAPVGRAQFFDRLMSIKHEKYPYNFQLQFSIHSTNSLQRNELVPVKKWTFAEMNDYGDKFYQDGGKKITLNFALTENSEISIPKLSDSFSKDKFIVKLTPVNPTYKSKMNNVNSFITEENNRDELINEIKEAGFDVILSIGEWEENKIGSNCGQYIYSHIQAEDKLKDCYNYKLHSDRINV